MKRKLNQKMVLESNLDYFNSEHYLGEAIRDGVVSDGKAVREIVSETVHKSSSNKLMLDHSI